LLNPIQTHGDGFGMQSFDVAEPGGQVV
jgi:hypothetical protein